MTDVLYAARSDILSDLYTLNTATGAETSIGPIGYAVSALARRDDTTLFGITAQDDPTTGTTTLLVIDKATGAGTEVGPLGLTLDSSLPGVHDAELLNGVLYVSYFGTFGLGELGNDLATVDQDTGAATFVGIMVDPDQTGALCFASSGGFWHAPYPQAFGTTYHLFSVDTSAVATMEGLFSDYALDADLFSGFHSFATLDGSEVFALVNTDLGYVNTDEGPYTCQLISIDISDPSTPATTIIGSVLAGMRASTFGAAVEPPPPPPPPAVPPLFYVAFDDATLEPFPTWTGIG